MIDNTGEHIKFSEKTELLNYYAREGLNLIPLRHGMKEPVGEWKQYQQRKITEHEINTYFLQGTQHNVGVMCGAISDNLYVLDFDTEEIFHRFFTNTDGLTIVKTGRGYHVYFKAERPVKTLSMHDSEGNEIATLKGEGSYVVAPPSVHPNGARYEFIQRGEIMTLIGDVRQQIKEHATRLGMAYVKEQIDIELVLKGAAKGNRANSLVYLITFLRRAGIDETNGLAICKAWNKRNKPPLDQTELEGKVSAYYRYPEPYHYFYSLDPGVWAITKRLELKEKSGEKEKTGKAQKEEETYKRKAHFELNGKLYLEVLTRDEQYKFAYLNDRGDVELKDIVGDVAPVELPRAQNGELAKIVMLPDEGITNSQVHDPGALLQEIKNHIGAYCDMPELDRDICSYYVLFTWFWRKVNTRGYLRFIADTGKGKSRMKKVVGDMCFYPTAASGSGSLSGMFRMHELWHGTLIVDEADWRGEKSQQMEKYHILGLEDRQYFILSDKTNPKKQDVFDPAGPRVIAMREHFKDNALEARLFSLSPHETVNENLNPLLDAEYEERSRALRNDLAHFTLAHWTEISNEKLLSFKGLGLEPRLRQLAMPLSIIFQLWPKGEKEFTEYIQARQRELKRDRALSWQGSMFNTVYAIAIGDEELKEEYAVFYNGDEIQAITPSMVAKIMNTSARAATAALRSIGFEVELRWIYFEVAVDENKTITKSKRTRTYVVPDGDTWREAVQRYYYSEDGNEENIEIPDTLKSIKYMERVWGTVPTVPSVPGHEVGTLGTLGTEHNTQSKKTPIEIKEFVIANTRCGKCSKTNINTAYSVHYSDNSFAYVCSECGARIMKEFNLTLIGGEKKKE